LMATQTRAAGAPLGEGRRLVGRRPHADNQWTAKTCPKLLSEIAARAYVSPFPTSTRRPQRCLRRQAQRRSLQLPQKLSVTNPWGTTLGQRCGRRKACRQPRREAREPVQCYDECSARFSSLVRWPCARPWPPLLAPNAPGGRGRVAHTMRLTLLTDDWEPDALFQR
jgi:hypothetical protein